MNALFGTPCTKEYKKKKRNEKSLLSYVIEYVTFDENFIIFYGESRNCAIE